MQDLWKLQKIILCPQNLKSIKPNYIGLKMKQFFEIKSELQKLSNDIDQLAKTKNIYGLESKFEEFAWSFEKLAKDCSFINETLCLVTPCSASIALNAMRNAQAFLIKCEQTIEIKSLYLYLNEAIAGLNRFNFETAIANVNEVRKATANEYIKILPNNPPHEAIALNSED